MINIDDFAKVELRVGTVLEAEEIEGSEKLIKLKVDLGPLNVIPSRNEESQDLKTEPGDLSTIARDDNEKKRDIRQILAGVKKWYKQSLLLSSDKSKPENPLLGKQVIVVANLEPRMMMGFESQGMMLAADTEDGPSFLTPAKIAPNGAKIH